METLDRMPWAAKNSVFRRLAEIGEVRARNLKAMGMSPAEIAKATGLSLEEITKL